MELPKPPLSRSKRGERFVYQDSLQLPHLLDALIGHIAILRSDPPHLHSSGLEHFLLYLPPLGFAPTLLHAVHTMSLNGLDTAAVVEAYQSALADAGGW